MATKTITAAARKCFLRRPWRNANIGAANPFALYTAKNYTTVAKLPFYKRGLTLAKAYADQSPAALDVVKAEAKKNSEARRKIRETVTRTTHYGLFVKENRALYGNVKSFKAASVALAKKFAALSDSEKAKYVKKAAALNQAAERYIRANI